MMSDSLTSRERALLILNGVSPEVAYDDITPFDYESDYGILAGCIFIVPIVLFFGYAIIKLLVMWIIAVF